MNTQVSFTTDPRLKQRALEKAKIEGLTLKAVLTYAMRGFVEGKISLGLQTKETESEVEELQFSDHEILTKASKLAKLLE